MAVRERLDPLHLALEQGEDGRAVDLLSGLGSAEVAALLEGLLGPEQVAWATESLDALCTRPATGPQARNQPQP